MNASTDGSWALGLPPELKATGVLPRAAIHDIVEALAVDGDAVLFDLGCGCGGYGIEVARRTGTRLLGIDFSAVALTQAQSTHALPTWPPEPSSASESPRHWPRTMRQPMPLSALTRSSSTESTVAALVECRRILRPGERTAWSAVTAALSTARYSSCVCTTRPGPRTAALFRA
jgi:Methyltransferase domain